MKFLKKSITRILSTILAVVVSITGAAAVPSKKETVKKNTPNNSNRTAKVVVGGITLASIALFVHHFLDADKKALNIELEFIQLLNSFPTLKSIKEHSQNSPPNIRYFKLIPNTFVRGITCLLPENERLLPGGALHLSGDVVGITCNEANNITQYLERSLSRLYQIINKHPFPPGPILRDPTLFKYYNSIVISSEWKTNFAKRVYLDMCDFYCLFQRNIIKYRQDAARVNMTYKERRRRLEKYNIDVDHPDNYDLLHPVVTDEDIKDIIVAGSKRVVSRRNGIFSDETRW